MSEDPIDPDVVDDDLTGGTGGAKDRQWDVVTAVAVGGIIGAEARFGLAEALPHGLGSFPWSTVAINVSGSALIAVLMVLLSRRAQPPRLARPLLGVGVLGGYTTFSTFTVDVHQLLLAHRPLVAAAYVAVTVVGAAVTVWAVTAATERVSAPG